MTPLLSQARRRYPSRFGPWLALLLGCTRLQEETAPSTQSSSLASAAAQSSIGPPPSQPAPRKGMVWIPSGALVAGTPPDLLPRKPDEEMKGEQVILKGYYMDVFPYPNEEGAIPLTNVTQTGAQALCAERGKRLCTELEWERACKGPDNLVYEYGDRYRPDRCGTGDIPTLRPAGLRVGCRSDFGVRDLHGGAFEWTSSPWGRGTSGDLVTIRGGNGTAGEIVGRCANGEGKPADTTSGSIGFRCCEGPVNTTSVVLTVRRGRKFDTVERIDSALAQRLLTVLSEEARAQMAKSGKPRVERMWIWRPVGNEDLFAAAVCAGLGTRPSCGVLISRDQIGTASFVAWASSGNQIPSLHIDRDPRDIWLLGGDEQGRYKRLIAYAWGRVSVHGEERNVGPAPKAKKKK